MISSVPIAVTLTVLFTLTGAYALTRWSAAVSARTPAAHRTAELAHVVMSAAMVVMTWTWYGSTGLWVQIALFTVFGAFFAVTAVRGIHCGRPGRVAGAVHGLMAAAMVWMLAAMPVIMPTAVAASGGGGHEGHGGSHGAHGASGTDHTMHAGQAGWAVAVTVGLCVALLVAAGFWAARAVGRGARAGDPWTPDDPDAGPVTAPSAGAAMPGSAAVPASAAPSESAALSESTAMSGSAERGVAGRPGVLTGARPTAGADTITAGAPRPGALQSGARRPGAPRLGAREDAACHAVMSVGMVLMLAAMVAGW